MHDAISGLRQGLTEAAGQVEVPEGREEVTEMRKGANSEGMLAGKGEMFTVSPLSLPICRC